MDAFATRYGPWALVAGASEGLGEAFAEALARRGLNLALVARRLEVLDAVAGRLRAAHGVEVRTASVDLADPGLLGPIRALTDGVEVGLVVYNAAYSGIGPFLEQDLDDALRTLAVNCRGPLVLAHTYGREMAARGRGGIVLMSSMSGLQGSPLIATYAASKAFDTVLGEALWEELGREGVDVLPFLAGPTGTPNYHASEPRPASVLAPPVMDPAAVAGQALAALGHGPRAIAGVGNRVAAVLMERLLPRRTSVSLMGKTLRKMYGR